ncbi:Protein POLLENLESS 3 [Quillaja saponaria]|uniref:Protein POLLENLESS 3 n=1 Tax=Quillaja saponaria TaxID=32244 RepID=A0AAD7PV77_QUISA|nr:Protein POLLENLESS 3 [Quillaja saponaria]
MCLSDADRLRVQVNSFSDTERRKLYVMDATKRRWHTENPLVETVGNKDSLSGIRSISQYLSQIKSVGDWGKGRYGSSGSAISSRNPTARRSLRFGQQLGQESGDYFCALSSSPKKNLNFESYTVQEKRRDSASVVKTQLRGERGCRFSEKSLINADELELSCTITSNPVSL